VPEPELGGNSGKFMAISVAPQGFRINNVNTFTGF
jgi:hypothetical protein